MNNGITKRASFKARTEYTFICHYCGKKVHIQPGDHSKRRKFCSDKCCRKYYKVPGKYAGQPAWQLSFMSAKKYKQLEEKMKKVGRQW